MTLAHAEAERNSRTVMASLPNKASLAGYIEHTLLKPQATLTDIGKLCEEASSHSFRGICIPPYYVDEAARMLQGSSVKLVTVVGFPLGYNTLETKLMEAQKAISDGAEEIDMVVNIAAFKSGNIQYVQEETGSLATLCHLQQRILKVIIETALLSTDEMEKLCEICAVAEADFVKTSTGFASSGARVEDIKRMRAWLPDHIKIKAAGGIRDKEFAWQLVEAGADRLGTSAGIDLIQ